MKGWVFTLAGVSLAFSVSARSQTTRAYCDGLVTQSVQNSAAMHAWQRKIDAQRSFISRKSGACVLRLCTNVYGMVTSIPGTVVNWCTNWLDPTCENIPSTAIVARKDADEWARAETQLALLEAHHTKLAMKQKELGTAFDRDCYNRPLCTDRKTKKLRYCYRWAWEFIYAR